MIVSDATAIIALINIDELALLKEFARTILLPEEVYREIVSCPHARACIDREIAEGFMEITTYNDPTLFRDFCYLLDAGESAAIAIAFEQKLPLIIDEKKGRAFARRHGVVIIGLIGILRYLYTEGTLSRQRTEEIVDKLNASDFRISEKLLEMILRDA